VEQIQRHIQNARHDPDLRAQRTVSAIPAGDRQRQRKCCERRKSLQQIAKRAVGAARELSPDNARVVARPGLVFAAYFERRGKPIAETSARSAAPRRCRA